MRFLESMTDQVGKSPYRFLTELGGRSKRCLNSARTSSTCRCPMCFFLDRSLKRA